MPNKRLPPTKRIDNEISALRYNLGEDVVPKDVFGKLVKLAMRRIVQEVLENEVSDFTGRDYYKHAQDAQDHRNGYEPSTLKTGEGHLDILRPQVRNTTVPFESQTWTHLKKNTQQLEHMAVEMYVNGCSTRDIEDLLKDEHGRILLSKSGVSRLNETLWDEYQKFCKQPLTGYDVAYIFVSMPFMSLYTCLRAVPRPLWSSGVFSQTAPKCFFPSGTATRNLSRIASKPSAISRSAA